MYHSTGVQKLIETQKSKLRNGHPVRIKQGCGNNLHLTPDFSTSTQKRGCLYAYYAPRTSRKTWRRLFW